MNIVRSALTCIKKINFTRAKKNPDQFDFLVLSLTQPEQNPQSFSPPVLPSDGCVELLDGFRNT